MHQFLVAIATQSELDHAMRMTRVVCVALAVGVLAGCGDDDDDGGEAAKPVTLGVKVSGDRDKLTIDAPTSLAAGVATMRVSNATTSSVQADVTLIRADGNHTVDEALKVINADDDGGPIPGWLHGAGGVAPVQPGATETSTQILQPGRYFVIAELDVEDNEPDPATAVLEVTGKLPEDAALPKTAATITASEYTFKAEGLKAGAQTVRFENSGRELHHAVAFPIQGDATIKEITAFFKEEDEPSGQPPLNFEEFVGTAVMDGGAAQNIELSFKAGRYALVCFIQNRAGGPPHVALGMVSEVTIR